MAVGVMHPDGWLFHGQHYLKPLNARQLHRVVVEAGRAAGLEKRIGPQTLRHCFATHLLEVHAGAARIVVGTGCEHPLLALLAGDVCRVDRSLPPEKRSPTRSPLRTSVGVDGASPRPTRSDPRFGHLLAG